MTSTSLGNFARWSGRSEEMHILAEEMQDPVAKAMMLRLSAEYGHLAECAGAEAALGQTERSPKATDRATNSAD